MKKVIIIGGGKSIVEGIEKGLWEKINGQEVWSLNFSFMTMPFLPSKQLWVDYSFYRNHITQLQELYKKGVPCVARFSGQYKNNPDIKTYNTFRKIDKAEENSIFVGELGLVGTFSLGLAIQEEYDEIFILGFDFGTPNHGEKHTHYYQDKMKVKSSGIGNINVYRQGEEIHEGIKDYDYFCELIKDKNINIYNVSLDSNIQCFPKLGWDDFFKKLEV